ncbi:MAG: hypothetical protein OEM41_05150, partial [Ignavibacteria bacterium]|nr:hypothetical protein [Ignavibacteria bacterium]
RLSLSYDDGVRFASVGRIIPSLAPSVGYVDGVMLSHRFGRIRIGALAGFDPNNVEAGLVTNSRKVAVTASYLVEGSSPLAITAAYARTYFSRTLDREVVGIQANISSASRMFMFVTGEVDLRRKSDDAFVLGPSLTNVYANLTYRLTTLVSVGVGANASRPWYSFSRVRAIPDSLLDMRLRGGASAYLNILLPGGLSLSNTYSPRSSEDGFGEDFSDNVSLIFSDPLSSGLFLRSSANLTNNSFSRSLGYGVDVQRNIAGIVDLGFRYQQYTYDIKQIGEKRESKTVGTNVVISINRNISLYTSYDRLLGDGTNSHSVFTELSIRF